MKNRIILFVIILLGCVSALNAQNREYSAEIDTNYIMIGDQIHFRMKVKAEPGVITDELGDNEQKDLQGHFKQKCDLIRPEPFFLLQGRKTEVGQRAKGERQHTRHQRRGPNTCTRMTTPAMTTPAASAKGENGGRRPSQ